MDADPQTQVSLLLHKIRNGHQDAEDHLIRLVYQELRLLADSLMNQERPDHTLEPTALVHEAWIRLLDQSALHNLRDRKHFFGAAVRAMRQVLVDHARQRAALRRGGERKRVPLDHVVEALEKKSIDIQSLDTALDELSGLNQRQAQVVTLRFFGGLSMEEIAQHLDVSLSTVENDFRIARAWLRCRVKSEIG
jgi:RNA polymerase sigma factor (TIGR02999 family)